MGVTSIKEQVKSVADGFFSYTVTNLRKYTPHQLKDILSAIGTVEREVRRDVPTDGDFDAIKKKNFRLGNLRRSRLVVENFIRQRRIKMPGME